MSIEYDPNFGVFVTVQPRTSHYAAKSVRKHSGLVHQATVRGFDTAKQFLHGLMLVTGSRRLNCYVYL